MTKGETSRQGRVRGQEASLGCGTLILIALIVMIFSRGGDTKAEHKEVMDKLSAIEQRIERIERRVEADAAKPDKK